MSAGTNLTEHLTVATHVDKITLSIKANISIRKISKKQHKKSKMQRINFF